MNKKGLRRYQVEDGIEEVRPVKSYHKTPKARP
jgi:hypothetical protein